MLEWLIVGGGVHGTHVARVLRNRLGVADDDLLIVDDAPAPLAAWQRRAEACGMDYLRSPQAHHLGLRSDALRRFADTVRLDGPAFIDPYQRPALALFDAHCRQLIADESAHLRARERVTRIEPQAGGYRVWGRERSWWSRRVLLAPGPPAPDRPDWAAGVPHVFDHDFAMPAGDGEGNVAIIGGGITAGQLALCLIARGRSVNLVTRRRLHRSDFDANPCYAGPRCLVPFAAGDWRQRRRRIQVARHPGTLPRDVATGLQRAIRRGALHVHVGSAMGLDDRGVVLADRRTVPAAEVVVATGFADRLPGGQLISQLIRELAPPLTPCGFPAPQPDLQWRPGLYVTGRLAEMELGPMAGNIRGARLAGERLAAASAELAVSPPVPGQAMADSRLPVV